MSTGGQQSLRGKRERDDDDDCGVERGPKRPKHTVDVRGLGADDLQGLVMSPGAYAEDRGRANNKVMKVTHVIESNKKHINEETVQQRIDAAWDRRFREDELLHVLCNDPELSVIEGQIGGLMNMWDERYGDPGTRGLPMEQRSDRYARELEPFLTKIRKSGDSVAMHALVFAAFYTECAFCQLTGQHAVPAPEFALVQLPAPYAEYFYPSNPDQPARVNRWSFAVWVNHFVIPKFMQLLAGKAPSGTAKRSNDKILPLTEELRHLYAILQPTER